MNTVDIVLSPRLIGAYSEKPKLCIVIDILRASSSIITALYNGAEVIYPLSDIDEARRKAEGGYFVGAERNVLKCDFATFGNDPSEYSSERVRGQRIYFTTTNGTDTIRQCLALGHEAVIGGFLNIEALTKVCQGRDVLCVCAGWQGKYCAEDALFAGAMVSRLVPTHHLDSDAARLMEEVWSRHCQNPLDYLKTSDHYCRMAYLGKADCIPYCLQEGIIDIVPLGSLSDQGEIVLTAMKP